MAGSTSIISPNKERIKHRPYNDCSSHNVQARTPHQRSVLAQHRLLTRRRRPNHALRQINSAKAKTKYNRSQTTSSANKKRASPNNRLLPIDSGDSPRLPTALQKAGSLPHNQLSPSFIEHPTVPKVEFLPTPKVDPVSLQLPLASQALSIQARYPPSTWSIQSYDTQSLLSSCSALEFHDNGLPNRAQEGALVPDVEDLEAQEDLFKAVRATVAMRSQKTIDTVSKLSSDNRFRLFKCTSIRVTSSGDSGNRLSEVEQALDRKVITICAEEQGLEISKAWQRSSIIKQLVEPGVYMDLYTIGKGEQMDDAIAELIKSYPYHEAQHRRTFWEKLIFTPEGRSRVNEGERQREVAMVEQRIKTVAVMPGVNIKRDKGSRRTTIYPKGVLIYYPFHILDPKQNSLLPGDRPSIMLKEANAYVWIDLAYAVEAEDVLAMFSNKDNLERLQRLPVNRLFWNTDQYGKLCKKFHYLNHLFIEFKPMPESPNDLDALIEKASTYLIFHASACLHDYMKLLWLAAPRNSTSFQGDLPVVYLIAAVAFRTRVFCMHIRAWDKESNTSPAIIRYEAVEMGNFDLIKENDQTNFCNLYNSIQALAHHYAAKHKQTMIKAMKSGRDIAVTEKPDLSFVHFKEDNGLSFKMVDSKSVVQYEGLEESISFPKSEKDVKLLDNPYIKYDEGSYGPLPAPEKEDQDEKNKDEKDEKDEKEALVEDTSHSSLREPRRSARLAGRS